MSRLVVRPSRGGLGGALSGSDVAHPILYNTPTLIAARAQMKADYDANPSAPATWGGRLYKFAKTGADQGVPPPDMNYNTGLFQAFMYQATGDPSYVSNAWTLLNYNIFPYILANAGSMDLNVTREFAHDLSVTYDWIYNGLTAPQRTYFQARMHEMLDQVSGTSDVGDSDQIVGYYAGISAWYLASKDHNPHAITIFNDTFVAGQTVATGADYFTYRNAVKYFASVMARGGEWIESSEYNHGTMQFVISIALVYRFSSYASTYAGHFDEIETLIRQFAYRQMYMVTPDYRMAFQYGDEEKPHQLQVWDRQTCNMMLMAAMTDSEPERQLLWRFTQDFWQSHISELGYIGYNIMPTPRAFPMMNPYGTATANLTSLAAGWYAEGHGMTVHRDGLATTDCVFWSDFRQQAFGVDHPSEFWGDMQMYRKQTWVATHPFGYNPWWLGSSHSADLYNCHTVEGCTCYPQIGSPLPTALQMRQVVGQKTGTHGAGYAYTCGTQGGQLFPRYDIYGTSNYAADITVFCHEDTRSVLKLSSTTKKSDLIVVCDRVNAKDPETLPGFSAYYANLTSGFAVQQSMQQEKRYAWHWHMPEQPTVVSNAISWTPHKTSRQQGGSDYGWGTQDTTQHCRIDWLYPAVANVTVAVQDETAFTSLVDGYVAGSIHPENRAWRVKISPVVEVQWNPLLAVVSVTDTGETVTTALVQDASNHAIGTLISRTSDDDVLVMFNAIQGADFAQTAPTLEETEALLLTVRLRASGYTVTWDPVSATTKVFLCDLDPAHTWHYVLDGGASTALSVDVNGLALLSVSGSGAHTLVLT